MCFLFLISLLILYKCRIVLVIFFLWLLFGAISQSYRHGILDAFFSGLSCIVSVPFYTAFLPLLFWVSLCVCLMDSVGFCLVSSFFFFGSSLLRIHVQWAFGCPCRVAMANWHGRWHCWSRSVTILEIAWRYVHAFISSSVRFTTLHIKIF